MRDTRGWRNLALGACLALAAVLAPAMTRAEDACTWGEPGYRDCVDKLIAAKKKEDAVGRSAGTLDPAAALAGTAARTAPGTSGAAKKNAKAKRARPGAGSLTPVSPEELRITPPRYDPAQNAIINERRQRQFDTNIMRNTAPVPAPIMPPTYRPSIPGQICPSWGC
jgi:hypothetical protein